MAKWKIRMGILSDKTVEAVTIAEPDNPKLFRNGSTYYPGDIVKTDKDLGRHNTPSQLRYERLPDDPVEEDALADMTVAELRRLADTEEIDLGTAMKKDEILNTIRGALQEA